MYEGKAYANSRPRAERPKGDFFNTPKSLVWVAEDVIKEEFPDKRILEPSAGLGAISEELKKMGMKTDTNDLYMDYAKTHLDYLTSTPRQHHIITNPPFSLWDEFINKAKTHCNKFMFIGRLNYLSTMGRSSSGIWENLKWVMPFNRYVDYQTPYRKDGLFHVGAMATGWFIWERGYTDPAMIKILDVQKYAKLGSFNK